MQHGNQAYKFYFKEKKLHFTSYFKQRTCANNKTIKKYFQSETLIQIMSCKNLHYLG